MKCSNAGCGLVGQGNFCQSCGSNMVPDTPASTTIICSGQLNGQPCGAEILPLQNFCIKCGAKVDQSLFTALLGACTRCGTVLSPECIFCAHCGFQKGETAPMKLNAEGSASCTGDSLLESEQDSSPAVSSGGDGKHQDCSIAAGMNTPEVLAETVTDKETIKDSQNGLETTASKDALAASMETVTDKVTIKDSQNGLEIDVGKDALVASMETVKITDEKTITETQNDLANVAGRDTPEVIAETVTNDEKVNQTLNDPNTIADKDTPDKGTLALSVEKVPDKDNMYESQNDLDTAKSSDTPKVLVGTISEEEKETDTRSDFNAATGKDTPESTSEHNHR
ncbi:uncharacterized protein LOC128556198 [Mercenaria mercenaria]|uniref:uncharacterized protein LOC128556198 n=1 Tax=Mercenaria mercenaria TaxID=6596 RepID=UPI00234F3A24|nr:uncharacterized protein LOC128556198 [Mercenaria mercenaria]